ncbi:glycosyltransferase [Cytophagaceae bacterium YF14B1]|uniref:Glycosyltransferase n=1 Tax=Xanthocytophaga flava TaxID=3048013 RepID=A0AAE3U715_9BACT|nr:glycosyltransferase [Xanthocytophaga flavus]MDJ1479673.1 glycosyltransferase [Xanthocytophaga flavus]
MENKDIVMLVQQSWDLEIGSNARNLAMEFAKKNRVLYVNPPLDIKTVLKGRKDPKLRQRLKSVWNVTPSLQQVDTNIWVYTPDCICLSINWLTSKSLFRWLNGYNNRLLAKSVWKAICQLEFSGFTLFNDSQMFLGLNQKELIHPEKYIYYVRDYLITQDYFKKHGTWSEAELMQKADLVVANSAYLADYARKSNPRSYDIGQGCELDAFDPAVTHSIPAELVNLPRPIIGYTGFLTAARLDISLLERLADAKPDWSFVLVGPEDPAFKVSRLHQKKNVYFTGTKPPSQLPAYLQHLDVCINPQLVNELTIGNYPRKIDEYLGMGKPVVATDTRAMEMFADYVYLAKNSDEYIVLLEKALIEDNHAQALARTAFAKGHTWEASAQAMYDALNPSSLEQKEPVYEP